MPKPKAPTSSEEYNEVSLVSAGTARSEHSTPKPIELKSELQQERSASETTSSDESSSSDSGNSDGSIYNSASEYPAIESDDVSQPVARPPRKKHPPERYSPDPSDGQRGQETKGSSTKPTKGNRGRPTGKSTGMEEAKKKRKESKLKLHRNITKHVKRRDALKATIEIQKQILREKDATIDRLTNDNMAHEKAVQAMQADSLKLMNQDNIFTLPDDVVRAKFGSIFARCKRWAKKWALPTFRGYSTDKFRHLSKQVEDSFPPLGSIASPRLMLAVQQGKIAPHVVLNAFLNRNISQNFLGRPFAYLIDVDGFRSMEKVLTKVSALGRPGAIAEKALWRAASVRMLDPPETGCRNDDDQESQQRIQAFKLESCRRIKESFDMTYEVLLKAYTVKEAEERKSEVMVIMRELQELSAKLHAQDVVIDFHFLSDVARRVSPLFDSASKDVAPHRGMKLHGDDDDDLLSTELDGEQIDLIIEPLITGRVVKAGCVSNARKTWKGAIVWVVNPSHMRKDNTPRLEVVIPKPTAQAEITGTKGATTESSKNSKMDSAATEQSAPKSKSPKQKPDHVAEKTVPLPSSAKGAKSHANVLNHGRNPGIAKITPLLPTLASNTKPPDGAATSKVEPVPQQAPVKRKHSDGSDTTAGLDLPAPKKPDIKKVLSPQPVISKTLADDQKRKAGAATMEAKKAEEAHGLPRKH